ncbi:Metallo-dependent phosphatase-like protein [Pilobolus umbonatus]|nr:Metallo-dependent phosphatase-like protein [Pilobolus umbonatus]
MNFFQPADLTEPYSSVSFQHKQSTSPYPYNDHINTSKGISVSYKHQLYRWIKAHQRKILLLMLALLFLLYSFRDYISLYWTFIKIKMDNTMFDRGYASCGSLRKQPILYVYDTQHIQVVWEMNCGISNKEMSLTYWDGIVEEGITTGPIHPVTLDAYHTVYKALIGPITTGGSIRYSIQITDQGSKKSKKLAENTFNWHTLLDNKPIRMVALADNQFGMMAFSSLLRQIRKLPVKPDYLIHAGDAVQNYRSLRQWQTDYASPLTIHKIGQTTPIIYAHGNHDFDSQGEYIYTRRNPTSQDPWFAFSMGNGAIRFIVLDSNVDWMKQDNWLRQELQSSEFKSAKFRIVVVHVPPFLEYWDPEGWFQLRQSEWGAFIRQRYVPLFEQYGVDLVISGHQHNYARGERNGIHYSIIGGAGGDIDYEQVQDHGMYEAKLLDFHFVVLEFRPVDEDQWILQWDTYNIKGEKIDSAVMKQAHSIE